jgi:hypothetical protein
MDVKPDARRHPLLARMPGLSEFCTMDAAFELVDRHPEGAVIAHSDTAHLMERHIKHKDKKLSYFYYAVPISIGEKVFNYLYEGQYSCKPGFIYYNKSKVDGFTDKNYNKCGLIIYADKKESNARGSRIGSCNINVPAQRIGNYKISDDEEKKLFRLLGLRVWNLKKKLAEMQQRFYLGVDVGEGKDKSTEQIIEV